MARCELALGCVSRAIHRRGPNTTLLRSGYRLVGPLVPVRPSPFCRPQAGSIVAAAAQAGSENVYSNIFYYTFYSILCGPSSCDLWESESAPPWDCQLTAATRAAVGRA